MSRVSIVLGIGWSTIASLCCGSAQAELKIDCAYWQQDIWASSGGYYAKAYEWTDGFAGLEQFPKPGEQAGTVHIFVANQSEAPVAPRVTSVKPVGGGELLDTLELVWWRCLPSELAAGEMGQISVRLRSPQRRDLAVTVTTEGAPLQTVAVPVTLLPFRLQTVAWSQQGREVFLVAQATAPDPPAIRRVWLDGEDVTGRCRLLAPDFFAGVSPIVLRPPSPLRRGSLHTYQIEDAQGRKVGWTLRTVDDDGFVPLGIYAMYWHPSHRIDRLIQLGFNAEASFHTKGRKVLDVLAAHGIRTFYYTFAPAPEVRGHPALYCYCLKDEPDVADCRVSKLHITKRIGHHAPEMIRRYGECRKADPSIPASIVINMSLGPHNYYIYGQIADLFLPDHYALTLNQQLSRLFETNRYNWWAAGPRPVQFIMQVNYEDRPAKMTYRRPPCAEEIYVQYLYALAGGARGFWGFMWPNEGVRPGTIFHGPVEYPKVRAALQNAHATLGPLLPLINQSHPLSLARADAAQVKLTTLLGGQHALLIAVINKTCESLPGDFRYQTLRNLEVRIPSTPWLQPNFVGRVDVGKMTALPLQHGEDGAATAVLPELRAGALLLVTADADLPARLVDRHGRPAPEAGRRVPPAD